MENKHVGYILLGISSIIILIIFMFQRALTSFVDASCTLAHGTDSCPMYDTISQQTYLALGIVGIIVITSIVLIIAKPTERVIIKKRTTQKQPERKIISDSELTREERRILEIIQKNKAIFQATLIEQTGLHKAKMTRIIDRLESRGYVERKRRGMTNIVVLKE